MTATRRDERLVALGVLTKPHGLKGELRLKLFNDESDVLRPRMTIALLPPEDDAAGREATLKTVRKGPGALLVRLEGVDDREAAEALRGIRVAVPRDALAEPDDDEWYVVDLVGCAAILDGAPLGTVTRIDPYPTCDVLVIDRHDGSLVEIPVLGAYVGDVDVAAKRVEILTLDGLE